MGVDRQRTLPPDLFTDERWVEIPDDLFRTMVGLYFHVDDEGRQTTTAWSVRASIYPNRPDVTEELIDDHLLALDELGVIGIYTDGHQSYMCIRRWPRPSHPKRSAFPEPPEDFQQVSGEPPEDFSAGEREGGSEGERRAGIPPSPFCPLHRPDGTKRDCRHCGTARLAHEQWIREHREEP